MNSRKTIAALAALILLSYGTLPGLCSDWVEDEDMSEFYSRGVQRGVVGSPDPYAQQAPSGDFDPDYGHDPSQDGDSSVYAPGGAQQFGFGGGVAPQFSEQFGSQQGGFGGNQPMITSPPAAAVNQKPAGGGSWLGKLGKSIISIPKGLVDGTDDLMSSPGLWYGAGQLAGAGANAYMWNRYARNNPGLYNGYYNPLNPLGGGAYMNPYYGGGLYGNPLNPLGYGGYPYGSLGYGNPYNPYGYGMSPYRQFNPIANAYNEWNRQNSPYSPSPFGPGGNSIFNYNPNGNFGNRFGYGLGNPYQPSIGMPGLFNPGLSPGFGFGFRNPGTTGSLLR